MDDTASGVVFAMLGATVAVQTAQQLLVKGVLSEDELLAIFTRTIDTFSDPDQRVEAVRALQAIMPSLQVEASQG